MEDELEKGGSACIKSRLMLLFSACIGLFYSLREGDPQKIIEGRPIHS
jgi:hypothetical protein